MEELKIYSVDVTNCKNVRSFTAVFKGKCAHVTGENGYGKTTIIKALSDALAGNYPAVITKEDADAGQYNMKMTDGSRFQWNFNNQGQNIINYFEPNRFKPVRRDILKHICKTYFPSRFDINRFLTTTEPARRLKMISELIDVDLSEISARYSTAFKERKAAKKVLGSLEAQEILNPEPKTFDFISFVRNEQAVVNEINSDIDYIKAEITTEKTRIDTLYDTNKEANDEKERKYKKAFNVELGLWVTREKDRKQAVSDFNETQEEIHFLTNKKKTEYQELKGLIKGTFFEKFFDSQDASKTISYFPKCENVIEYESPKQPELKPLSAEELPDPMPEKEDLAILEGNLTVFDARLQVAQEELDAKNIGLGDLKAEKNIYDNDIIKYNKHVLEVDKNKDIVKECEAEVLKIQNEIKAIVKAAKMPDDFLIDLEQKNDILFRVSPDAEYLPINTETLASSAIFIAAFKLQANYSTQFKVIHFDVSYLSFTNRQKVIIEAQKMGIQLITESAAQNVSELELQYKIIEDLDI